MPKTENEYNPETLDILIKKCEKTLTIKWAELPAKAKEYYINYGVRKALNDFHSAMTLGTPCDVNDRNGDRWTAENVFAAVQDRAATIASGIIRTVSPSGDKAKAERFINIKLMRQMGLSSDDVKKNASDSDFVINCWAVKIAKKNNVERKDKDTYEPIRQAVSDKYDQMVEDQIAVYVAQREIQNETSFDLELDI